MKLTKLEHSGCIVENDGQRIVCDPVEFEGKIPEFENVVAIIITHKHGDHFQPEVLERIVAKNPDVRVFAPQDLGISEIAGRKIEKVEAGEELDVQNFNLKFFGENHAPIIPDKIPCANLGVVINDQIINPGDSFDVPTNIGSPKLLLVPSAAPWCKVPEGMEYIKTVKPEFVVPVHNAVLSKLGNDFNNNWLKMACDESSAELRPLAAGEGLEL